MCISCITSYFLELTTVDIFSLNILEYFRILWSILEYSIFKKMEKHSN